MSRPYTAIIRCHTDCLHTTENKNALYKRGNGPTAEEINTHTNMNYTKHIQAAENYANRSHKESEAVFTKFNRATYLNKILIEILKLR
jgi:hypothetical protein